MPLQGQFPPPLAQPLTPSVNEGEAGKSGNAPDSLSSQSQLPSGTQTSHLLEFFFFFFCLHLVPVEVPGPGIIKPTPK